VSTLLAFIKKELSQLRRDPKILPLLFVAPVFQLVILGYAATTDVKQVELAVVDLDRTAESRDLVRAFTASRYFRLVAAPAGFPEAAPLLERGTARLVLTVPAGFAAELDRTTPRTVQIVADGADATSGTIGLAYAAAVLQSRSGQRGAVPAVELRPTVRYNPDLVSRNFMVPGVLALILMVMSMMLTSMALVREGEVGTMEQLLVTPLTPLEIILGKLVPYAMVATVQIVTALPVALFWFRVPLRGSLLELAILTVPFFACTLGLGLLVSTLARTQQQAMMLSALVFMLPQIYLSGFIFPIQNMPVPFQLATYLVPLRYYVTILRGVFLKGVGFAVLWPEFVALSVMAIAILALARARFRRRLG